MPCIDIAMVGMQYAFARSVCFHSPTAYTHCAISHQPSAISHEFGLAYRDLTFSCIMTFAQGVSAMRKPFYLIPLCLIFAMLACSAPGAPQITTHPTEVIVLITNTAPTTDVLPTSTETDVPGATAAPTIIPPATPTLAEGGLALDALKNATYQTDIAPSGVAVLVDGHHQEPNPDIGGDTSVDLREPVGYGDINGDGTQDALVWLVAMTGNTTGRFGSLHAVLNQGGAPVWAARISLGDRTIVRSITVAADGLISVDMLIVGPNDGGCCPNTPVIYTYRLEGTELIHYVDGLTATPYPVP
jgi:hypothetical protein